MRTLANVFACLLAGLFICSDHHEPFQGQPLARVMVVSDPQYGWGRIDSCEYERAQFRKIADIVNFGEFDALIVLGDLAEDYPDSPEGRRRQVGLLLEDLKLIESADIYLLAGNHDLGEFSPPGPPERFEEDFGFRTWHAFMIAGVKFLALNSTLIKNYWERSGEYARQMDFIRENSDAQVILTHHPPFLYWPLEIEDYWVWQFRPRMEVLRNFGSETYFMSGHTHRPFDRRFGGWRNVNVGTCCAPWDDGGMNYGILEIYPNGRLKYSEMAIE